MKVKFMRCKALGLRMNAQLTIKDAKSTQAGPTSCSGMARKLGPNTRRMSNAAGGATI